MSRNLFRLALVGSVMGTIAPIVMILWPWVFATLMAPASRELGILPFVMAFLWCALWFVGWLASAILTEEVLDLLGTTWQRPVVYLVAWAVGMALFFIAHPHGFNPWLLAVIMLIAFGPPFGNFLALCVSFGTSVTKEDSFFKRFSGAWARGLPLTGC